MHNDQGYVRETSIISAFSKIKSDAEKTRILYYYLFLLERMLPEFQQEQEVFTQSKCFLIELSGSRPFDISDLIRHIRVLMELLGFSKDFGTFEEWNSYIEEIISEKTPEIYA